MYGFAARPQAGYGRCCTCGSSYDPHIQSPGKNKPGLVRHHAYWAGYGPVAAKVFPASTLIVPPV